MIMFAKYWRHTLCVLLCLFGVHMSMAQSTPDYAKPGDPARWYKDDSTARDHAATLRKEADAAYQEAKVDCHNLDLTARSLCMKEAQAQHKQDLLRAQNKEQASN
jgi:hypothetical protein